MKKPAPTGFKSIAHRNKMQKLLAEGTISQDDYDKMHRHTHNVGSLPDRVTKPGKKKS